ncbi:MAG: ParB/RepB/Spo0J family partition protein [Clostridia bacterium]|nr:ParB/RepB/Spo0J family partition protein [Clostridia bacterium]
MATKRSALGKGLGALLQDSSNATPVETGNSVIEIDINQIEPGMGQPRKVFDQEKIQALADSIKEHGIIQPIVVKKEGLVYRIIAGERRWRAARVAGLKKVPVIEREATNQQIVEMALIENIQREDLNPIEEANAYARLIQEYKMTQEKLSSIVGKSRSNIANMLRLLNFSEPVQEMLSTGEITIGQARPILALSEENHASVAQIIVDKGMNARQAEAYVKKIVEASKKGATEPTEDPEKEIFYQREIEYMQQRLRTALGTKVKLDDRQGKGKIVIEYYSKDERERLLEILTEKKS